MGNQLFGYAAARHLAVTNRAELVIDHITGFEYDRVFRREYELNQFNITARTANAEERMEPFRRIRRVLCKWQARRRPFAERKYIEQSHDEFDERLTNLRITETTHIEGIWASERYFRESATVVRSDLILAPSSNPRVLGIADEIAKKVAVALHIRYYTPPTQSNGCNLPLGYYKRAVALIRKNIDTPHFFIFSDNPRAAMAEIELGDNDATVVSEAEANNRAVEDLWLMGLCQHFIVANSTFSWWGAWLAKHQGKSIVAPAPAPLSEPRAKWQLPIEIPPEWIRVPTA